MKNGKFTLHYSFFILHFIILFTNHFFFVFLKRKYLKFVISLFKRMTMQTEVLMNSNMALLILCWQTACLSHEHENGKLLPGASSATEAESAELDKIHDEETPNASWDEFNKLYGSFKSASERTKACVNALQSATNDFKILVTNCMTRIANASREDENKTNMSPEEYEFIKNVREQLGLN
jgi:hypothetical protein